MSNYQQEGNGNNLIPLATFFREKMEIAETLLIEMASQEPAAESELTDLTHAYLSDARNTHFQFSCKSGSKRIVVRCEMTVEDI